MECLSSIGGRLLLLPKCSWVLMQNAERGAAGEAYVAGRLERAGYRILARNWRARGGEVDIVALDGEVLVFVEVRVRSGERYGSADESVDAAKLARIMRTAAQFVQAHPEFHDAIWRVDLFALTVRSDGVVEAVREYQNMTLD